ncbi:hypothetical protein TWF718_004897 [Orbilia javanica]|uniref:Uncharacterized protein n=1 Tax=Orbilia javanica TaxID=47235 RepID=A0AAN8N6Y9_9PEZI
MDPSQVDHAQAWLWQLNQQQMSNEAMEDGFEMPPLQFPTEPGEPIPDNPIFFNNLDQSMDLNNMSFSNNLPEYQQMMSGAPEMGMDPLTSMQTPMGVNTGIFFQNPLPVEQLMQNHPDMGMDLDEPSVDAQDLLEASEDLIDASFEDPTFDPSGSMFPQPTMQVPSAQYDFMGQIPSVPMPEKSLFLQSMTPPRGMPPHIFMMLKQQQQQQQQQALNNQMMGSFYPPSGLQMRLARGAQMPRASSLRMHPMAMQRMRASQAQAQRAKMSSMRMPQGNMSAMQIPGTPQITQHGLSTQSTQPSVPTQKVRFQETLISNPQNNISSPDTSGSQSAASVPQRPQNQGPMLNKEHIQQRSARGPNPVPVAPIQQVPKAVVQISQEPFSRTFPPNVSHENLKKGDEPPVDGQYPGGRMTVKDFQEYRSNMVYLGKPTGEARERIPAPLKHLGAVPQFQGNTNDFNAVKEHLNALTDWANQYVHAAMNTVSRYDNHTEDLTKQLKTLKLEKKHISDAIKEVQDGEDAKIPDFIRSTKLRVNELEETVRLLNYHHAKCPEAPKDLETLRIPKGKNRTAFDLQRDMLHKRDVEVETIKNSLKEKDETLQTMEDDLRQAKDLVINYQVQIQEMVNRENFNNVAKVHVLQQLLDTQEAAKKLESRYNKLFERAKALAREVQGLKTTAGWLEEHPDLLMQGAGGTAESNLLAKYRVLFENSKFLVGENARLKEQLRAETSILELQAEYDKLKAQKAELEGALEEVKGTQKDMMGAAALQKGFIQARKAWNNEKSHLQNEIKKFQEVIRNHKATSDEASNQESTIKGLHTKNSEMEKGLKKAYENLEKLKSQHKKVLEEKEQIETKTAKLMEIHKLAMGENTALKERRLARQIEVEALKKRLKENGPEKIIRIEAPGSKKGHECLMTRGELMEMLGQEGFREYMHSYLKAVGYIKEGGEGA